MNLFSLIILAFGLCVVHANDKVVYCFWGTWATYREGDGKFEVEDINVDLCTHIAYSFLGIDDDGRVKSLDSWLDMPDGRNYLRKFSDLKKKKRDLFTLIAVGGWGEGSEKYSLMAGNETLRANFVDSVLRLIIEFDLDGLEFDWEYPNRRDTVYGEKDIENFTQLLSELRYAFDEFGYILTAAVSAVEEAASQSYDVAGISEYLDYINVMTYEFHGPWDNVTGHNAALHKGEGDGHKPKESLYTADVSIDYWINSGAPPEKILMGVPFFGHSFELVDAKKHKVGSESAGPGLEGPYTVTPGTVGWNEFCVMLQTEPWNVEFDHKAQVPYAYKGLDWVSYDDPNSIKLKTHYAKHRKLAGIMIWSIESDDFHANCGSEDFPMLRAINHALGREVPPPTTTTEATSTTTTENNEPSSTTSGQPVTTTEVPVTTGVPATTPTENPATTSAQ